ncbi:Membrane-bound metal-dependent hydrolase YdjM, induced during SOS response, partial [uncultured Rubrobacteraceae bacterium]
ERHDTLYLRGRGPGWLLPAHRGGTATLRLPRGRLGRIVTGRGQPAQPARERVEPDEEPGVEPPDPALELGFESHFVRALSHRRAPDAHAFLAWCGALLSLDLTARAALPGPVPGPLGRLRFAPLRRRFEHERSAAPVADGAALEALAGGYQVGRGSGVRGSGRRSRGGGVRGLCSTPRALRSARLHDIL